MMIINNYSVQCSKVFIHTVFACGALSSRVLNSESRSCMREAGWSNEAEERGGEVGENADDRAGTNKNPICGLDRGART